jgi:hypothetical protein
MDQISQKTLGIVLAILGVALFIALMGDLLFRVVGGLMAIALTNYGLQLQGQPSVYWYIMNLLNFKR